MKRRSFWKCLLVLLIVCACATPSLARKQTKIERLAVNCQWNMRACAKLTKIATRNKDPRKRYLATQQVTDQSVLDKIALNDADSEVRKAAVSKLTDQPTLADVARGDEDPSVRKAAVIRLTDPSVLSEIARRDADSDVRKAAVSRLSDLSVQAWQSAQKTNTVAVLEAFLKTYGTSQYASQAKDRLDHLQAKRAWQSARNANTIAALNSFLKNYGASEYASQARSRIDAIENNAWGKAKAANTPEAYKTYLKKYGKSPHTSEAQGAIQAIYRRYIIGVQAIATKEPQIFSHCDAIAFSGGNPYNSPGGFENMQLTTMTTKISLSRATPKHGSTFVEITWRTNATQAFEIGSQQGTVTINGSRVPRYVHPWLADGMTITGGTKKDVAHSWSKTQNLAVPVSLPFDISKGQDTLQFLYVVPTASIDDAEVRLLGQSHRLADLLKATSVHLAGNHPAGNTKAKTKRRSGAAARFSRRRGVRGRIDPSTVRTIAISPEKLKFIRTLGPDIVFFTSSEHPIKSLAEINAPASQFAVWGPGKFASMPDLMKLEEVLTGKAAGLHVIGNGNFSGLFQQNPHLKLFVTFSEVAGVNEITAKGGGMRVRFVERKR